MVLNRLPCRDADAAIGEFVCHPVEIPILIGRDHSTWQHDTNHIAVRLTQAFLAAFGTQVAIVLLVSPVKLQQLHIVMLKMIDRRIFEHFVDGASQQVTLLLSNFNF